MEAVQAVIQKHEVMLAASFKDIFGDLSDDGSINSEKIRKLAKKLGENVTPGEIKKMAKELAAANLEDFGIVETNSEDIRTLTKELSQNATVEQITKVAREIDAANPDEVGNTDNSRRR